MIITDQVAMNRREIEALKASQRQIATNMKKNVSQTIQFNYNYASSNKSAILVNFRNTEDDSVPFAIMNISLSLNISGSNYISIYNVRQLTPVSVGNRSWYVDLSMAGIYSCIVYVQIISNVRGEVTVTYG